MSSRWPFPPLSSFGFKVTLLAISDYVAKSYLDLQ